MEQNPQAIHEALIKTHYGEKIAGHISRDATAIHAREKATAKPQEKTGSKPGAESKGGKRGRRRTDDPPAPPPEPKRLQQQLERDLEANLADLPINFDWGCKKNSSLAKRSRIGKPGSERREWGACANRIMHDKEIELLEGRVENFSKRIGSLIMREQIPLEATCRHCPMPVPFAVSTGRKS